MRSISIQENVGRWRHHTRKEPSLSGRNPLHFSSYLTISIITVSLHSAQSITPHRAPPLWGTYDLLPCCASQYAPEIRDISDTCIRKKRQLTLYKQFILPNPICHKQIHLKSDKRRNSFNCFDNINSFTVSRVLNTLSLSKNTRPFMEPCSPVYLCNV